MHWPLKSLKPPDLAPRQRGRPLPLPLQRVPKEIMKKNLLLARALTGLMALGATGAFAQNIAIVNGKAVPKARVDALAQQLARSGRPVTPEMQGQIKEEVIAREVFMQEAEKLGLSAGEDFKTQMELARQAILIRELFADFQKKNPVTDAELKGEY